MSYLKLVGIVLSLSLLTGCSYFGFGKDKQSVLSESPAALEIPPNLSVPKDSGLLVIPEPNITRSSQVIEKRVLQEPEYVELLRDGDNYWIRVTGNPENIWGNLLKFWQETQIKLRVKNKAHGIIETSWFVGDDQRFASDTKNKFRLRIEKAEKDSKKLEIYITHYGAIATDTGGDKPKWISRERDKDLEVEFLHQIADYLDREQSKLSVNKKRVSKYNINNESLIIAEDFKRTWRRVGIALEKASILISDQDRAKGIYFVTEVDFLEDLDAKRGPLDRYIFGDKIKKGKPFEVHIESKGEQSVISITGETMSPAKKVYVLKAIRDHI
ncbi:MAG: outer membrane protein assembly factor BamC [Chromatiales bacterium]|nr:outer membrane protein assembly factor BamC [Chromatiales bacterium]